MFCRGSCVTSSKLEQPAEVRFPWLHGPNRAAARARSLMAARERIGVSKGCRAWLNEGIEPGKKQDFCLVGVTNTVLFSTQAEWAICGSWTCNYFSSLCFPCKLFGAKPQRVCSTERLRSETVSLFYVRLLFLYLPVQISVHLVFLISFLVLSDWVVTNQSMHYFLRDKAHHPFPKPEK